MSRSTSLSDDRRTSGRRAARLVAARLQELGRPADLLTDDALATLCEAARGSPARLHALLASALFLASTEDAGAIEADHVRRAALSLGAEAPAPAPARPRWCMAAAVGAGVCALAALALELPAFRHDPAPAAAPARPSPAAVSATHVPAPPPRHPPAAVLPTPARPQKLPPVVQPAPPPPAPAEPVPPLVALPEAPPAIVIIRYKKGNKAAEARAHAVASRLASAQLNTQLQAKPRLRHVAVGFFYQEDRALALRVAAAAGLPAPARENPFDAATLPRPGTIEVALP